MVELLAHVPDWAVLTFLSLLLTAGFALGEIFNITGVFAGKPDFALFFFVLGGLMLVDISSGVVGVDLTVPLGVFWWGAFVTGLFAEEGRTAIRVFPTC